MDKLRSLTGRSEDFGATNTSQDSVQFSKPKIGVKMRGSNSMTAPNGMKGRVSSKPDLVTNHKNEHDGSKTAMASAYSDNKPPTSRIKRGSS